MTGNKQYIGDGVYAAWNGWSIVLTTEVGNGVATNEIILEPEVWRALLDYHQRTVPNRYRQPAKP